MEFPDVEYPQATTIANPKGNVRDELALLRRVVNLLVAMNDGEITIHPEAWGAMAHIDAVVTIDTDPDGTVHLRLCGKAPDGIRKLEIDGHQASSRTMMKLWLKANKAYLVLCDLMTILGEKEYFIPHIKGDPIALRFTETDSGTHIRAYSLGEMLEDQEKIRNDTETVLLRERHTTERWLSCPLCQVRGSSGHSLPTVR